MSVVTRIRTSQEVTVPFTPEEVWDVLADVAAYPGWWPVKLAVELLHDPGDLLGAELEVRPLMGRMFRIRFEELENRRTMRLRFFGGSLEGPGGFHLRRVDGGTEVRFEMDVFARGLDVAAMSLVLPLESFHRARMRSVLNSLAGRLKALRKASEREAANAARRLDREAAIHEGEQEAARRAEEEAERRAEEEGRKRAEQEAAARAAAQEAERRAAEEEAARRAAEEQARKRAEEEAAARAAAQEVERRAAEEEAARRAAEEEARKRAEEEAAARAAAQEAERRAAEEEAARRAAEEQARKRAEEEAAARAAAQEAERRAAEEEAARRAAEEEARKRAEEEAAARAAAQEAERRAAEEEAARRAAEEEARKRAEEEAAARAAAQEAERRAAEEEAARRAAEEEARKRAEEEAAARAAAQEAERRAAEEEATRRAAEEEARKRAEEEDAARASAQEAERRAAEEEAARRAAEEEARKRAEEEAAARAAAQEAERRTAEEEAARRAAEEEARKRTEEEAAARAAAQEAERRAASEAEEEARRNAERSAAARAAVVATSYVSGEVDHAHADERKTGSTLRRVWARLGDWFKEAPASVAEPIDPPPPAPHETNFEIARRYLVALSGSAGAEEIGGFFAPEASDEEFPHRFRETAIIRDFAGILEARSSALIRFASQRYELLGATGGGSSVAMEVRWKGTVATTGDGFVEGQELDARIAMFLKFAGERIVRQRMYPCFEPWSTRAERLLTLEERVAQAGRSMKSAPPAPHHLPIPPQGSNFDIARRYLEALGSRADADTIGAYHAADAVQDEFPNRLLPGGAHRDLLAIKLARSRGLLLMASETYELLGATGGGSQVALEVAWSGVVGEGLGLFTTGQGLEARVGIFLKFRDGLIVAQRNYDCPFADVM